MRAERKKSLEAYDLQDRAGTIFLLTVLFALGLWISLAAGPKELLTYLLAWSLSYGVIYRGTCAGCVYYGKPCPIPAEGEWVHRFVRNKQSSFGRASLCWATASYLLRISVPVYVVFRDGRILAGLAYGMVFAAFWIVHLFWIGCPNCVNVACPLNPDFPSGKGIQTFRGETDP